MNIPNNTSASRKKKIVALIVVIILIAGAGLVYLAVAKKWFFAPAHQQKDGKSINYNPPTNEQKNATGSSKNGTDESQGSDQSPTPTQPTSGGKASIGMTITAANQTNDTLLIRTLIQTISSNGTCTLSMVGPDGKAYAATAGVQANPSTSTCQGFNVPMSALAPGSWHITIDFEDSSTKTTASKDVTLQ